MDGTSQGVVSLSCNGFSASLHIGDESQHDLGLIEGNVSLNSSDRSDLYISGSFSIYMLDLTRLCTMLNEHISDLSRQIIQDRVWVPIDLSFQVNMLDGEIESIQGSYNGYFTISIMINLKRSDNNSDNVYAGFSGTVQVSSVLEFTEILTEILADRYAG